MMRAGVGAGRERLAQLGTEPVSESPHSHPGAYRERTERKQPGPSERCQATEIS